MPLLVFRQFLVALLGIDEVGDGLHQEIALDDHIGIKRHHIRGVGQRHGVIQVAGFGALVVGTVGIPDAHVFRKLANGRTA